MFQLRQKMIIALAILGLVAQTACSRGRSKNSKDEVMTVSKKELQDTRKKAVEAEQALQEANSSIEELKTKEAETQKALAAAKAKLAEAEKNSADLKQKYEAELAKLKAEAQQTKVASDKAMSSAMLTWDKVRLGSADLNVKMTNLEQLSAITRQEQAEALKKIELAQLALVSRTTELERLEKSLNEAKEALVAEQKNIEATKKQLAVMKAENEADKKANGSDKQVIAIMEQELALQMSQWSKRATALSEMEKAAQIGLEKYQEQMKQARELAVSSLNSDPKLVAYFNNIADDVAIPFVIIVDGKYGFGADFKNINEVLNENKSQASHRGGQDVSSSKGNKDVVQWGEQARQEAEAKIIGILNSNSKSSNYEQMNSFNQSPRRFTGRFVREGKIADMITARKAIVEQYANLNVIIRPITNVSMLTTINLHYKDDSVLSIELSKRDVNYDFSKADFSKVDLSDPKTFDNCAVVNSDCFLALKKSGKLDVKLKHEFKTITYHSGVGMLGRNFDRIAMKSEQKWLFNKLFTIRMADGTEINGDSDDIEKEASASEVINFEIDRMLTYISGFSELSDMLATKSTKRVGNLWSGGGSDNNSKSNEKLNADDIEYLMGLVSDEELIFKISLSNRLVMNYVDESVVGNLELSESYFEGDEPLFVKTGDTLSIALSTDANKFQSSQDLSKLNQTQYGQFWADIKATLK